MITIYKKKEKTIDNPTGIVEIANIKDLNKPFLLCLSAQNNHDKSIYGIMREGASIARVYTTKETAAKYKIDDFPIDFLGLRYQIDDQKRKNYEEIVDDFLYPFLINDTKDIELIKKRALKINFMTYCDGTETYRNIENRIIDKLKSDGFSDEDITNIISKITLTAIGTMSDTSSILATSITFVDLSDEEISTDKTESYKKYLQEKKKKSMYGLLGKNLLYIYNGNGNHNLLEYFKNDNISKVAIATALSYFLEISLTNNNPSLNELVSRLNKYTDETQSPSVLLSELDNSLKYNSSKYTEEEIKLRQELDATCKKLSELIRKNCQLEKEKTKYENNLNSVINSIKENCDDSTFYNILVPIGLWQYPSNNYQDNSNKELFNKTR